MDIRIQTYTGKWVNPLDMTVDDIDLCDIAHALAMKCRFTGHCSAFYSVAQHSVLMSRVNLPGTATWRLMHDASEAYLPDIASPIKTMFPLIIQAEKQIMSLVQQRFGLPEYDHDEVKKADKAMLVWEGQHLFTGTYWRKQSTDMVGPLEAWTPDWAEQEFLDEAGRLLGGVNDPRSLHRRSA